MRKHKKKILFKFEWRSHNFPAWNGLITAGKDRSPKLLKALKPMTAIYIHCHDDWPEKDQWVYGCGYYLGKQLVYFLDVLSGSERLVSRNEIEVFSIHKFVGCKDVFHDASDDAFFERALIEREKVQTGAYDNGFDPKVIRFQNTPSV